MYVPVCVVALSALIDRVSQLFSVVYFREHGLPTSANYNFRVGYFFFFRFFLLLIL